MYNEILNYVPKSFTTDTINRPERIPVKLELNTIASLKISYALKNYSTFHTNELQWFEQQIEKLATALFHDGKRILIGKIGGASGCTTDKLLDTIQLDTEKIIYIKFCRTCTDYYNDDDFIEIFNTKMYELMQIIPSNGKTHWFYGTFKGKAKHSRIKLELTNKRTFKFWVHNNHSSDFTEGFWSNKNDTLLLKSKRLNSTDSLNYKLSSANWIELNDVKFRLKRKKLIELETKKWKLKQIQ